MTINVFGWPLALIVVLVSVNRPALMDAQSSKPTTLEATTVISQQAPAGANVSTAPVVRVLDQRNDAMPGVSVTFTVTSGGGTVSPATTVSTNGSGLAQLTSWRLGNAPGGNAVTATLTSPPPGNTQPSVTFSANGFLVPTTVEAATPTSLSGFVNAAVSQPPTVRIRDQFGRAFPGASVAFAVTAGGGSISPALQSSGADGVARVTTWTLGPNSGTNKMKATLAPLPPIEFTATAPFTLVAFVKRADGTAISNPQLCIGSKGDLDVFATVRDGGTIGRQTFSIPWADVYAITASKGGYVGQTLLRSFSGSSAAVTITLTAGSGGQICPGALVESDPKPDLSVKIAQSSNPIVAGTQQTYTIKVRNGGASPASSIVVKNTLPADLTFVSSQSDRGFGCSRVGTAMTCSAGTLPVGDSATITVVMSLPTSATSGHGILLNVHADPNNSIPEASETNNHASAVTTTEAVRLGEETRQPHGVLSAVTLTERGIKQLDCKQFWTSFVMVGIEGNGDRFIERLRLLCSDMRVGGALNSQVSRTEFFFKTLPSTYPGFERRCPTGFAVSGFQGSLTDGGMLISLMLQCRAVGPTGRTTGIAVTLGPTTPYSSRSWGPDLCSLSRPGRALKIGISTLQSDYLLDSRTQVVGAQLVCEQPVVPVAP